MKRLGRQAVHARRAQAQAMAKNKKIAKQARKSKNRAAALERIAEVGCTMPSQPGSDQGLPSVEVSELRSTVVTLARRAVEAKVRPYCTSCCAHNKSLTALLILYLFFLSLSLSVTLSLSLTRVYGLL